MGDKKIMVAAWILMLMLTAESSGAAGALTEVVDEKGSQGRLLKGSIAPSAPSHCHNNHQHCQTPSSPSKLYDGKDGNGMNE